MGSGLCKVCFYIVILTLFPSSFLLDFPHGYIFIALLCDMRSYFFFFEVTWILYYRIKRIGFIGKIDI